MSIERSLAQMKPNRLAGWVASESFYYVMEAADDMASGVLASSVIFDYLAPHKYQPWALRGELKQTGRLPLSRCIEIGLGLAGALENLHQHGLVHRDVKPVNVIFVGGQPKLADIGLVSRNGINVADVGTEGYIPPEGSGSARAEIYSLGKLLYETSTGCNFASFPGLPEDRLWWIGYRVNGKQTLRSTETADRAEAEKELAKVQTLFMTHRSGSLTDDLYAQLTGKGLPRRAPKITVTREGSGSHSARRLTTGSKNANHRPLQRRSPVTRPWQMALENTWLPHVTAPCWPMLPRRRSAVFSRPNARLPARAP